MSTNLAASHDQALDPGPLVLTDPALDVAVAEDQCDCACAAELAVQPRLKLAPHGDALVALRQPFPVVSVAAEHYATLAWQGSGAVVLDEAALQIARHYLQPHRLADHPHEWDATWGNSTVEAVLAQLLDLGVLAAVETGAPAAAGAPGTASAATPALVAWLHLTDRCNLACAYCFLPHRPTDLSPATGRAAIDATLRSAQANGYQQVKLKYAGGEPLLRFDALLDLHQYAQAAAAQVGVTLDAVVLTNGTLLTEAMVQTLRTLGLRLMISLDGLDQVHDQQRCYAGGRSSFADVKRAIALAGAGELTPEVSITVTGRNVAGLPALVKWLLDERLRFGLNFYRENDAAADQPGLSLDSPAFVEAMLAVYAVIEDNLPDYSLLGCLLDRTNLALPHLHTCQAGRSYLAFDAGGRVAACQMHLAQPACSVEAADPLRCLSSAPITLRNVAVDEKPGCQACAWRYWCTGGCPLTTWRASGSYAGRSPNCHAYQALLPHVLRLEGKRILGRRIPGKLKPA